MSIVQAAIIGSAIGTAGSGYPIPGSGSYAENAGVSNVNGTAYDPGGAQASVDNSAAGFYRRTVQAEWWTGSYAGTDMAFFDGKTVVEELADTYVSFGDQSDVKQNYSMYWLGYFRAPTTTTYNLRIASDDQSMVWIGTNAISGFTGSNCVATQNTTTANSLSLTGGVWYPIRIWYHESGGNNTCQLFIGQTGSPLYNVYLWASNIAYNSVTNGLNITPRVNAIPGNTWSGLALQNTPTNNTTYLTFNGTNQSATVTPGLINTDPSGDFTIEMWARTTNDNGILVTDGLPSNGYNVSLIEFVNGDILAGYWNGTAGVSGTVQSPAGRNYWHHYVYAYNSAGPQLEFFIDGVRTNFNLPVKRAAGTLLSLFHGGTGTNFGDNTYLAGDLGEFRLWDSLLSDTKVQSQYDATKSAYLPTYTLSTAGSVNNINEGTALTFNLATERVLDGTKLYYDITSTGSYPITRDRWGLPGSVYFSASGKWLSATVPAPGGSSDATPVTYEWWVYPPSVTGLHGMLQTRTGSMGADGIDVFILNGTLGITTSGAFLLQDAGTINPNEWTHIAIVRTGTGKDWKVYINGVNVATITPDLTFSSTDLYIGTKGTDGEGPLQGYMTNFRYVKGTAVYTNNFTPLPAQLTAITGTELLLLETNSAGLLTDSSGNNVTVTNTGGAVWNSLSPIKLSVSVTSNAGSFSITTSSDVTTATGTQLYTVALTTDGSTSVGNTVSITVNDTSITIPQWHTGDATASGRSVSYRYYKFNITKIKNISVSLGGATQISELIILNGSTKLTGGTATNPGGTQAFPSEGPSKALTGYYNDKWCDTSFATNGYSTLIVDYGTAQTSTGFTYATANDYLGRDPVQWTFEGSNDGSTWDVIHEQIVDATITTDRNTLVSTVFNYPTHGSAVFNFPQTDYISLPALPDWNLGTTWTVEFWIYMNSSSDGAVNQQGGIWGLLNQGGWAVKDGINIALSGGYLQINQGNNTSYYNKYIVEPTPLQWVHVAIVNNAGTNKVYYNGIEQIPPSNINSRDYTASWTNSTKPLYIGCLGSSGNDNTGGGGFDGKLTNLRITDRAEYLTNFNPPTVLPTKITNHTRLLWTPTDQALATDTSDDPHTITNTGVTYSSSYPATNNTVGSSVFDGSTNRYYKVPGGSHLQLGTTWTIEWWQKTTALTAGNGNLYTIMSQSPGGGRIDIFYQSGNLVVQNDQALCAEPPMGVWVHVAIVNNAGSGTVYYNGIAQSASGNFGNYGQTQDLYIGKRGNNTFQYFNGKMTNIRITDTAVYTSNFVPNLTPTLIAGHTKLLLAPTADTINGIDTGDLALALGSSGIRYSSEYPVKLSNYQATGYGGQLGTFSPLPAAQNGWTILGIASSSVIWHSIVTNPSYYGNIQATDNWPNLTDSPAGTVRYTFIG